MHWHGPWQFHSTLHLFLSFFIKKCCFSCALLLNLLLSTSHWGSTFCSYLLTFYQRQSIFCTRPRNKAFPCGWSEFTTYSPVKTVRFFAVWFVGRRRREPGFSKNGALALVSWKHADIVGCTCQTHVCGSLNWFYMSEGYQIHTQVECAVADSPPVSI